MIYRACRCASLGLLALSLLLHASETKNAGGSDISITVQPDKLLREIPRNFLGLAVEKEQLTSGEFARSNAVLSRLLENLGEGTLRIVGESVDYTPFAPTQAQLPSGCRIKSKRTLTSGMVEEMFRFAQQAKWQVIYGLNLGCYAPGPAAEEAKYVYSASLGTLLAFEVGNEPDMFFLQGYRAASRDPSSAIAQYSWDTTSFIEQYDAYSVALQKAVPDARLSGPGVGLYLNGATWLPKFLDTEPQALAFTSTHFYPMVRPDGLPAGISPVPESSPAFPTIAHMLNPKIAEWAMEKAFAPQMRASQEHKVPFRITELNSAARGGQTGVSDVFASALWILDYSFRFLALGADGINLMTDLPTGAVYSAIQVENGVHVARPVYYGMLFFHQCAQGQLIPAEVANESPALNFSAYSTVGPDRTIRVTLINKDPVAAVRAHIQVAGTGHYESATILRLSAPSLDARSGIEIGGTAVNPDGTWKPKSPEKIAADKGVMTLTLPPGSAALVVAGRVD